MNNYIPFNQEQYHKSLHKDLIDCLCFKCGKVFLRKKQHIKESVKRNVKHFSCSRICRHIYHKTKCKECENDLTITNGEWLKSQTKRLFCNSSCSASYNNRRFPKRKKEERIIKREKEREQRKKEKEEKTLGDVVVNSPHATSAYVKVRALSRRKMIGLGYNYCQSCHWKHMFHICHIKPVHTFEYSDLVSKINNIDNLVSLCPNCHWLLDNIEEEREIILTNTEKKDYLM